MAVITSLGTRPVGRQVRRAAGLTLGTVAGFALVAAVVTYGAGPASEAWAHVAGDPGITLADGAALVDVPERAVQLGYAQVPVDAASIAAAFGGPAREVTSPTEVERLAGPGIDGVGELATMRYWVVPAGYVQTPRELQPGSFAGVSLRSYPGAAAPVVATTSALRARFLRAVHDRIGISAGGLVGIGTAVSEEVRKNGDIEVSIRPTLAGAPCDGCGYGWATATFAPDGRLLGTTTWALTATTSTPITVLSAAEAFEDLRHHRDGSGASPTGSPVVSAVLAPAVAQTDFSTPAYWTFVDANGDTVGTVIAQPGMENFLAE